MVEVGHLSFPPVGLVPHLLSELSHRHLERALPVVRAEAAHAIGPGRLRSLEHWDDCWLDCERCANLWVATGIRRKMPCGQSGRTSSGEDRCVHSLPELRSLAIGTRPRCRWSG